MTDKANVQLTLTSEIEGEVQEHTFTGEWYRKGRTVYVRYTETDESSGEVRTVIRWRDGQLHIARRGVVDSEQNFVAGSKQAGEYKSPFARFKMVTDTSLLWMQCGDLVQRGDHMQAETDGDGELLPTLPMLLEWHYNMYVDEELTGEFKIKLKAELDAG
ncbi:DUF1934 domain-containing protein [Paenibacillus cellulosilyticus]|uniref:DUF1934 domain-containing protein n=1 Tax=Paenibacillus cellulosilyticus TaxID=375489 RepID=UPI0015805AE3|nr:DUF1934 domain-containing protein [Paenibacillus cellulosilyticus]QKS43603.1 DUF1934 domain-containing protein [Paenibacillus cellulosilyticus]